MIFKQGVLKEEKIKFCIGLTCVFVPLIFLIIFILINENESKKLVFLLLMLYAPTIISIIIVGLKNFEWYFIYDDRIEVRCIFGIKNVVFYDKILSIEEVRINLITRGMKKIFYIFNDGRKNNNNIWDVNSCYNNRMLNLRIYKTSQLENYLKNCLKLKVNSK